MIESSWIYRWLCRFGWWLLSSIRQSAVGTWFLSSNDGQAAAAQKSLLWRGAALIRRAGLWIMEKTHLVALFSGSIYKQNFFWMALPFVLSPLLPTMAVIALAVAALLSLVLRLVTERSYQLVFHPMMIYVAGYGAVYLVSIFTSVTLSSSFYGGAVTVLFVAFSVLVINGIEEKWQVDLLLFLMAGVGLLVAGYGFYQFLNPGRFGGTWVDQDLFEGLFRVYSTFQNPNVLGEYFLLIIPFACAGFFHSKRFLLRAYYVLCAGGMLLCLMLTYSRGCYLGILAAAFVFLVLLDKRFILLAVVGLLLLPFVLPDSIMERFMSITNLEDSSTSYRLSIWLGTLAMLKDYWISGIGPGEAAFNQVYPVYAYNGISAPHSHNTFLQVVCDAGILGLVFLLMVVYQYFKATFRAYLAEHTFRDRVLMIGAISAMVGFLVQSIFDYTFYNYRVMLLFWAIVGFGVVISRYASLKDRKGARE
ncbi:MAG TPA: O-antigen ligase family protein [Firmicutes bacterium]|nr:O-antigen ligase family protein [Bacillota bacterium]